VGTELTCSRKALYVRLSVVLFFAELAHGMLLYGIIPEIAADRFGAGATLFGTIPLTAVQLAGFCLAAYTFAELFSKIPAGHWVDRQGPDLPLRVGLVVSLLSVPVILLARRPDVMLFGSILHGLGAAPAWPAVISAWTRGRSARERGEIMGQILTFWMAGLGAGLILGNILVGVAKLIEASLRWAERFKHHPPPMTPEQVFALVTYAPVLMWAVAAVAAFWPSGRLGTGAVEAHPHEERPAGQFPPELKPMMAGLFLQNLAFGSLILAFRETVTHHLNLGTVQFGLMILFGGGPAVLLLGPMGKVSDRIGRRNSVIRAMFIVAPLIAAAPVLAYLPVSPWVRFGIMIPGILVAGVAYALMLPAWHALALGRIPEAQRGKSLALLMSVEMMALAGGHLCGPALYARIHFSAPFLFAGATFAILAGLYSAGYILPAEVHDESPPRGHPGPSGGSGGSKPRPTSPNGKAPGGAPGRRRSGSRRTRR
jgi:DHA1 family multidrug resistance protein-like MFS transporter